MTELAAGGVAVVTGGATGIGAALATALAERGQKIALVDLDSDALAASSGRLTASGAEVLAVEADVADRAAMDGLRDRVMDHFGRVDVVCANAGVFNPVLPAWEQDLHRWRRLFEVNYWGVVHTTLAFLPAFFAQGSGHLLITASMSGLSTVPNSAPYVCSKHAVVSFAETLRADLDLAGRQSVGITLLCPSLVQTRMGEWAIGQFQGKTVDDRAAENGSGPNLAAMLSPEALSAAAIDGILSDKLYVLPTPQSRLRFQSRVGPIVAAFEASPITH